MSEPEKNNTIVVESNHREPIEIAHKKAKEVFTHVSNINSNTNGSIHFFVIVPDKEGIISAHVLLEPNIRQTFIEWCFAENEKAHAEIYKIDIIKY